MCNMITFLMEGENEETFRARTKQMYV
jgi:hypothetical protein